MTEKRNPESCCKPENEQEMCCVEAFVSVDDRGQMVIPKDVREKANITAGEKLVLITWEKDGKITHISLINTGDFSELVKDFLGQNGKNNV
jgi:AbrB family looped-hinge helix DNA binding protein